MNWSQFSTKLSKLEDEASLHLEEVRSTNKKDLCSSAAAFRPIIKKIQLFLDALPSQLEPFSSDLSHDSSLLSSRWSHQDAYAEPDAKATRALYELAKKLERSVEKFSSFYFLNNSFQDISSYATMAKKVKCEKINKMGMQSFNKKRLKFEGHLNKFLVTLEEMQTSAHRLKKDSRTNIDTSVDEAPSASVQQ